MADCPYCRKSIDPLATRCPYCRGAVQLTPAMGAEPTLYTAVVAPALGAGLMSLVFCGLSPFSGLALHYVLGRATDLSLLDYMVGFDAQVTIAFAAMGLSALCGWLRQQNENMVLSLLSFAAPLITPPLLVIAFQVAEMAAPA